MFRLKRKMNLAKMAKASASCPAINEMHLENSSEFSTDTTSPQSDECESDDGGLSGVSRKERMFALKSIRRDRKREKDQRKKLQSNNISMDDFLSKQSEFKIWLKEEKNKQSKELTSPKLKTYFKTFVKHWNRKKLNQKYYRGAELLDTPQPSDVRQRFIFADTDSCSNGAVFPRTINLSLEGPDSLSSPFSTFGKSPLGLPITKETLRRPPASKEKILPVLKDDTDKENQQANIKDDTEHAVKKEEFVRADSGITVTTQSNPNLYEVSVLSWTSRGELATDRKTPAAKPRQAKPVPPLQCPGVSESRSPSKHKYMPYQEVQDIRPSNQITPGELNALSYPDPGYMDIDCYPLQHDTTSIATKAKHEKDVTKPQSPPAIYAVPIKKKKMVVSTNEGSSYTGIDMSAPPPPIPPKRKSPLECWPYANSLMGTNIPAPYYSMNKAIEMQKLKDGVSGFRSNVQSSYSNKNKQLSSNCSVKPCNAKDENHDMNNKQSVSHAVPTKSCIARPAYVAMISERTETPPPQLVPIPDSVPAENGCQNSSNVTSADSRLNKHSDPLSFESCKPLRFETTFSATDTESPVKRACSGMHTSVSLNNILEATTHHQQRAKISSTSASTVQTKIEEKPSTNIHLNETRSGNNDSCKVTSAATSSVSSQNETLLMKVDDVVSNKLSVGVFDNESCDEVKSQEEECDLYETDIDDLDDDDDDDDDDYNGHSSTNMNHGVIETDLDKVLEKVTQQNKVSTCWLVNTDKETTV